MTDEMMKTKLQAKRLKMRIDQKDRSAMKTDIKFSG